MSENKSIQLGLCCLNIELRECKPSVFSSRSVILKTLHEKGVDNLKAKIIENLQDVLIMMDWNEANGIKVFRLSSEMFPHISNPNAPDYTLEFAKDLLKRIGEKSKKYNQRLTFHPGHFNCLGSPTESVIEHTIRDLDYHASVLDMMDLGIDSVMVIHGGGIYGDKNKTIERWCENYIKLPDNIKRRLVLENCERNFSIEDCLRVSEKVKVPVVFDTHHYECYNIMHPNEKLDIADNYIPKILETWKCRGIKPKFHVSEQGAGKCGHHSDYIETIPNYLLEIPEKYKTNIDIMIEAKMKEKAIFKLYEKYPYLDCKKI
ncbi:UV DNA damage repair endonuclease UvsE [archaeon]|nr:UV DNA damage repair endonuclease UvsE [archaeon]NDB56734.1 UV DNA damage repair endonuclease UvsE [archaeon]NDB80991.1 UV DNA damage repair endonuclease UvsE [archaeon]